MTQDDLSLVEGSGPLDCIARITVFDVDLIFFQEIARRDVAVELVVFGFISKMIGLDLSALVHFHFLVVVVFVMHGVFCVTSRVPGLSLQSFELGQPSLGEHMLELRRAVSRVGHPLSTERGDAPGWQVARAASLPRTTELSSQGGARC